MLLGFIKVYLKPFQQQVVLQRRMRAAGFMVIKKTVIKELEEVLCVLRM